MGRVRVVALCGQENSRYPGRRQVYARVVDLDDDGSVEAVSVNFASVNCGTDNVRAWAIHDMDGGLAELVDDPGVASDAMLLGLLVAAPAVGAAAALRAVLQLVSRWRAS